MKIVICNSRDWFSLDNEVLRSSEVISIRDKGDLTFDKLKSFDPDLVFFPHWNWIVEENIFSSFTCVVFHTAPLPYGRGGSPIQNLIIRGHKNAPVCAFKMSDGIDNGPIYDKRLISLDGTLSDIISRLNDAVNELIKKLICSLPDPEPQVGDVYTFKRLGRQDNEICLDSTFEQIYDKIRMLDDDSYPSAYLSLDNLFIEFFELTKLDDELSCKVRISKKTIN